MKRFGLALALTLFAGQSMFGFSLMGPYDNEGWQDPSIGYHLSPIEDAFWDSGNGDDIGSPKNVGQIWRFNTPVLYYAYDQAFANFFGTNGMAQVDAAFAMFNNLTNASNLNPLNYPLQSSRINHRAQALNLMDLKSYTMSMIIEQLGLATPDRWTWALHSRDTEGAQCPNYGYTVIQRNFDPLDPYSYSKYVNGVLYNYQVAELCTLNPNPYGRLRADAVEFQVDPVTDANSLGSVAAYGSANSVNSYGTFFLNFTRDDIGGLKYLFSATNMFREQADTNSLQIVTNNQATLVVTSNLQVFAQQALTNDSNALQLLYPGLVILNTSNWWTNVITTNISAKLVNPPFSPAGTIALVLVTNYTTNVQPIYFHTFANLEILHAYSKSFVSQQTVTISQVVGAPAGTYAIKTNTTTKVENITNGDFYILPTNLCGPYQIVATQLVTLVTNLTNLPLATNGVVTNTNSILPISVSLVNYFTNYSLIAYPVNCVTNSTETRQGMEKIIFVRKDYPNFDSMAGEFWTPVTNIYHLTAMISNRPVVETFQRIITKPDILITAADLAAGPGGSLANSAVQRTVPHWNESQVQPNAGGPGTIEPTGIVFTYNNVGPVYYNLVQSFLKTDGIPYFTQGNSVYDFRWGSFDGSTNTPVVYPDSASILAMEAQLFFQITSGLLPDASVSANTAASPYNTQLQVSGGTAPYNWSLAPNSPGLPPGLALSPDGVISGIPVATGTYDFTVQVTDSSSPPRSAQQGVFIVVSP